MQKIPRFAFMNQIPRRDALKTLGLTALAAAAVTPLFAAEDRKTAASKDSEIGFKDGKFVLPPLPYEYSALEPVIDEQTMKLHHDIHHAAYVKGANVALEALAAIGSGSGDASLISYWNGQLAFNESGHALHTMFWNNMKPKGGSKPTGALAEAIKASFGSHEAFEKLFTATAGAVQGSGWGILGFDALSGRLQVISAEKHQNLTLQSITPILAVDVWEHAYYLKYQNKRADYVKGFMTIINYEDVGARLAKATAAA
jgi:Fe-Mn family superoxide dismutase